MSSENLTIEQADELMNKYVELREKCKTSKSKKAHRALKSQAELCLTKFDYIVQNRVKRYRSFSNYDDLIQDGRIALMLALNSYELGKGSFFWWANQYVKTKISREANRHSTIKIPIKHTKVFQPYKVSQMPVVYDDSINAADLIEKNELISTVQAELSKLNCTQKKIIEMYYSIRGSKSNSLIDISNELNISKKECAKTLREVKNILKQNLCNL